MTITEAYRHFAAYTPEQRAAVMPRPMEVAGGPDLWPATATALATLTGMLPHCNDERDLNAAARAGGNDSVTEGWADGPATYLTLALWLEFGEVPAQFRPDRPRGGAR